MDEGGIQGGGAFDRPDDSNIASSSSPPPPLHTRVRFLLQMQHHLLNTGR
jgi:hypothetical protein